MFLLKKHHQCDYVDCDEFGWWLTGSKPEPQNCMQDVSTSDGISTMPCDDPDHQNSFVVVQDSAAEVLDGEKIDNSESPFSPETDDDDPEKICFAEEPPCETCSRSYTPERLVRIQDYTILSPSPTFSSPSTQTEPSTAVSTPCKKYPNKRHWHLNHLIDQKVTGASQLEALFDPDATDIKLPVSLARKRVTNGHFFPPKKTSASADLLAIVNSDSPKRPLTPDLISSGSSCERLNSDWNQSDSVFVALEDSLHIEQLEGLEKLFGPGSNSSDDFLNQDIATEHTWRPGLISGTEEDPEITVEKLRGRIDQIRDTNRDIFGDISSLRKNFQWAETKAGNLTTETTRLRREIQDLRYLDDLVNLLRGELERISQRNWPFNLGHTDLRTEEVNLVV